MKIIQLLLSPIKISIFHATKKISILKRKKKADEFLNK